MKTLKFYFYCFFISMMALTVLPVFTLTIEEYYRLLQELTDEKESH